MIQGAGRLTWTPLMDCDDAARRAEYAANVAACDARRLDRIAFAEHRLPLHVVGGSPSVSRYGDEFAEDGADVWASGSAFAWLRTCWTGRIGFFTIDRHPLLAEQSKGADYAIVASCCAPVLFDALAAQGVYTRVFHLTGGKAPNHGSTSITAVPWVAKAMGYWDVTFYGCESSYPDRRTHAYEDENENRVLNLLEVSVALDDRGIVKFRTNPDFLIQAEFLAKVIRAEPHIFKYKGGGLLDALVKNPEYAITGLVPGWSKL